MAILYPGLHDDAVKKRHVRYAQALVDAGYGFELLSEENRPAALDLLAAATAGASRPALDLGEEDSGMLVRTAGGELAAVLVVTAVSYDNGTALFIRALATDPQHRSRGIATVLLGLAPQVLAQAGLPTRAMLAGTCPEQLARFLHRAGFAVHEPGAPSPVSFGGIEAQLVAPGPADCWFLKEVA